MGIRSEKLPRETHVVGRERPPGALAPRMSGRTETPRVNAHHVTELPFANEPEKNLDGRVVEEHMADHQMQRSLARPLAQKSGMLRSERHWLLYEHMVTRLEGPGSQQCVRLGRRGDDDCVEPCGSDKRLRRRRNPY